MRLMEGRDDDLCVRVLAFIDGNQASCKAVSKGRNGLGVMYSYFEYRYIDQAKGIGCKCNM